MGRVLIIARREISSLFISPIAYVVLFLFLLFMGILFIWRIFTPGEVIELRRLTDFSRFALFFVVPLLTMSMFSDEYRSGRIEMLRTSPITEFDLLAGKFIGAMAFYLVLVASTLLFLAILMCFGRPDFGQLISCYLGMALMGCMFVAVGLFFSSCTAEQIVAAMAGIITLGMFTITDLFSPSLPREITLSSSFKIPIRPVVDYLTVGTHIGDFAHGSVGLGNTMYFLGFAALFLFWTYLVLESKKWR
jgi:ABC-2 type transport system permease protein